jgi:predicted RNase H-like nuclease (RuvC/YqgF family)
MTTSQSISSKLDARLKKSDPRVQNYVSALEKKNAKLEKEIAELEVENMSLRKSVNSLTSELKDYLEFKKGISELSHDALKDLSESLKKSLHNSKSPTKE